ncbi:MAG: 4a-hydroxytetrahydrobiopterin dehydratase [Acidimicrobiia bacterium]|nr:4a-hydroxytetrahydrobiopterin dehydratase [Acidimicrobiia bacterium]NNF63184.1 4a-hydroxytetrahydrobiopterin dehydratase [Acidimicrobiia bacterium]
MARLDDDERQKFLTDHRDWSLDEETISRTFKFGDFNEAMGFVTRVAIASEVADHHPDIDIRWNKVTIALSTHSENALTSRDTSLASQIDGFLE